MSACSPSRRENSFCSTFCSPLTANTNKWADFFPQLIFHKQALCWSRMEVRVYWTLQPPDRLSTLPSWKVESRGLCLVSVCAQAGWCKETWGFAIQFWGVLCAKLCGMWWFNNHMCELSVGIAEVSTETRCMVLYSLTSLLNNLLLFRGNCFCSAEVSWKTACFLQRGLYFGLG